MASGGSSAGLACARQCFGTCGTTTSRFPSRTHRKRSQTSIRNWTATWAKPWHRFQGTYAPASTSSFWRLMWRTRTGGGWTTNRGSPGGGADSSASAVCRATPTAACSSYRMRTPSSRRARRTTSSTRSDSGTSAWTQIGSAWPSSQERSSTRSSTVSGRPVACRSTGCGWLGAPH